jgi:hypothetical protein
MCGLPVCVGAVWSIPTGGYMGDSGSPMTPSNNFLRKKTIILKKLLDKICLDMIFCA